MTKNAATTIPPTWAAPAGQPAGIAGQGITAVAVDPTNANQVVVVYPGFSGVNALLNPSRHVFMTTDDGTTWSDISGVSQGGTNNLPDLPLYSAVIDPNTTPHTIIVAGDGGVFQTGNQGKAWQKLGTGLPNAQMEMLALDSAASPELLRVASWGRGVFELSDCVQNCEAADSVCILNCEADFASCQQETPHLNCRKTFKACKNSCEDDKAQCVASCK